MRILHIIGSARLESGGPIEGIRQRSAILMKMGHSVEIASLDSPDPADFAELGVKVTALGPGKSSYRYCPKLVPWLTAHAKDFDVLIVNGIWQYHGWAVRKVARRLNKPYFVFTHGMLDPWFNRTYPLKHAKKLLFWPWEHAVLRDANAVLFTTEEERLLARESFRPYHIVERVVPYGTAAAPAYSVRQLDEFFNLVPGARLKRVILYLGRIHVKKGLDMLIEAFAKVLGADSDWVLVAGGPDHTGWRAELERTASSLGVADRIFWPGMLKGEAKWGAFQAAEAFALPSHQENFGISVAEALSCGTPVLISDKVNIWREVAASEAGFVAPDTLSGTINLLQRLSEASPSQLSTMAASASECFSAHFEVNKMATGLLEVIAELGQR